LPISTGNAQEKVKLGFLYGSGAPKTLGVPNDLLDIRLAVEDLNQQELTAKYKDRLQSEDIHSLALSRDAVFLLADAVGRAGSLDPKAVRDALAATENFQGATGTITMDQNGDPQTIPVPFFRFENGKRVFIKTVAP
jgi:branched-chain amino acid transport system substrate-binding protein